MELKYFSFFEALGTGHGPGECCSEEVIIVSITGPWGRVLVESLGQMQYCDFITQAIVKGSQLAC